MDIATKCQTHKAQRLIDADALIDALNNSGAEYNYIINKCIMDAPTIDAVEVVRCKDCKYSAIAYPLYCRKGKALAAIENGNNFCSYGERSEE